VPAKSSFDYALVRIVPRVERDEFVNAGVILFCRTRRFLAARVALPHARLALLDPAFDLEEAERHLASIPLVCGGGRRGGPIGELPIDERFLWLVSPRSSVIQTSAVHCGLCDDPQLALDGLFARMTGE
jgi:hypothetical protein